MEAGSLARYAPFGDWRTEPTTNPTLSGRGFTGHRHNNTGANDLGLIYMRARFYVPSIGRFASADTIVPEPADPQSHNRYSYGYNNPLRYTDPSGHISCDSAYLPGQDQAACSNPNYNYPSSVNLEAVEQLQRGNAVINTLSAWPASIASQATILKRVQGLAPVSEGPLNEVRILPNGSFVRVPAPVARVSTAASYGLPILTGTVNQIEIYERYEASLITSREAGLQTVNNGAFTSFSVWVGGGALPAAASVVEAPVTAVAVVGVSAGYNLTVAQSTVNNMIEGQSFSDAFWNARANTNDRFTFGHGQELEAKLNRGAILVSDFIIWAAKSLRD